MEKIVQFFSNPQIDPDSGRRRRLLNILLAALAIAMILTVSYTIYIDVKGVTKDHFIDSLFSGMAMFTTGIVIVYVINRHWTSRLAGLVLAFLFAFSIVLNSGEEVLYENIYLLLVIPILIASFFAAPWVGFLAAGFVGLWVALISQQIEKVINFPAIAGYFLLATIAWLSARSLESAVSSLRDTNHDLDQHVEDLKRAEATLQRRNQELSLLNHAGQTFSSTLDLDEVLANVFGEVQQSFNAIAWSIWLVDQETQELVCYLVDGPRKEVVQDSRLKIGEGIAGWSTLRKETVLIADAELDPRIIRDDRIPKFEMRSVLSVPLVQKNEAIGVLQILDTKPNLFTADDRALLELLATSASAAIENAQLYDAAQREIAERKRAEAALRESETRYRTLIETSPDAIIAYDQSGTILMANPKAAALYGVNSADKVVGKRALDFTAEEDYRKAMQTIQDISEWNSPRTLEVNQIKADGTRFPIEASMAAFPSESGQSLTYISVMRDITARKEAERATAQRHKRATALNTIVTTLNQKHDLDELLAETLDAVLGVIGVDTGWIQLLGTTEEGNTPTLKTRSGCPEPLPARLLPPGLAEDLISQVRKKNEPILTESVTTTFRRPGDCQKKQITFPIAVLPIRSREREEGILGVLGIADCQPYPLGERQLQLLTMISYQIGTAVENIHLVKEAAEVEALREMDSLRTELIANFSHDLRTPLGLIKMSCTTLMRDDVQFDRETQAGFLEDIETQTDTLTEIVDNMLELARIESGGLKLNKHPVDLATLAKEIVKALQTRLARHTITLDFPNAPLITEGDKQHISAVFRNLLDNAIKYSRKGTAIAISGRVEGQHILVQIRDHGIGIPMESIEKIFERFYRVENRTTRHVRGVGLGLAVCRGIIKAHKGEIWVQSVPGKGSTFSFTLPALNGQTATLDRQSDHPARLSIKEHQQ